MDKTNRLPEHIAFIMDGNGRWAEQRGLSRVQGHHAGVEAVRTVIAYLDRQHVPCVSLYSFSTENWRRPRLEVSALLRLVEGAIDHETLAYHKKGVKLRHLGSVDGLSRRLRQSIDRAIELTRNNTGMTLGLAFNYGSRQEIVEAARRLIAEGMAPEQVDEKVFTDHLYTAGLPDVDLVIRTGGEIRVSNFLMWQAAYAEYYFTPVLWPDFGEAELEKALLAFAQRQRRFGGLKSRKHGPDAAPPASE